jgi:hypothetical protein
LKTRKYNRSATIPAAMAAIKNGIILPLFLGTMN